MADIEWGGPVAPDSELDPPIGVDESFYTVQDGGVLGVLPNDWVDLDTKDIDLDPLWGSSFQVLQCYPGVVTVKMYNQQTELYEEAYVTPDKIINNYRRQKKVYE